MAAPTKPANVKKSSCQLGAVHTWHIADERASPACPSWANAGSLMGPNRRAQERERAAAEAAAKAKGAEAERKAVAEAQKIVAVLNARQAGGQALWFYPTIGADTAAGLPWLSFSCPACGQFGSVDLRTLDWHPGASISSFTERTVRRSGRSAALAGTAHHKCKLLARLNLTGNVRLHCTSRGDAGYGGRVGSIRRPDRCYRDVGRSSSRFHWENVGLIDLFAEHEAAWQQAAKEAKEFIAGNFPEGSKIRRDDVSKSLIPILEINEILKGALKQEAARQIFGSRILPT